MSRPTVQDGAASKVLNAAHDAARVRLQRDAERISAAVKPLMPPWCLRVQRLMPLPMPLRLLVAPA